MGDRAADDPAADHSAADDSTADDSAADDSAGARLSTAHGPSQRHIVVLGVGLALVVGWGLTLRTIGTDDVYAYLGPYAVLTIAAAALLVRGRQSETTRGWARNAGTGIAVGLVMTAGTYGAFAVLRRLIPSLEVHVIDLYGSSRTQSLGPALAWTLVILVAEELLWRELLLRAGHDSLALATRIALSLGTYVLVQVGSGSWVVALAALVCGAIWTTERVLTRSLLAPLLSHAIWTETVIHLYPVTAWARH